MKDQKEVQTKISSENKVKPPLLKSIYSQEVKIGRIDNNVVKNIKTQEDIDGSKTDYSKFVYRSREQRDRKAKKKKVKKQSYKSNKTYVLENFEALYNGLNILIETFEKQIFESKYRPEVDQESDLLHHMTMNIIT